MHKMRNLTVEDISPGCVRLRSCVEYVIGVYTLTKQAGGFLFPDLPHKNTAIYAIDNAW